MSNMFQRTTGVYDNEYHASFEGVKQDEMKIDEFKHFVGECQFESESGSDKINEIKFGIDNNGIPCYRIRYGLYQCSNNLPTSELFVFDNIDQAVENITNFFTKAKENKSIFQIDTFCYACISEEDEGEDDENFVYGDITLYEDIVYHTIFDYAEVNFSYKTVFQEIMDIYFNYYTGDSHALLLTI